MQLIHQGTDVWQYFQQEDFFIIPIGMASVGLIVQKKKEGLIVLWIWLTIDWNQGGNNIITVHEFRPT